MTSDRSDLVKQGYMKIKGHILGGWKKTWVMLLCASNRYICHLEQFENREDAILGVQPEVTILADVEHVQLEYSNNIFVLILNFFSGKKKKFALESESEAYDWFEVLKQNIGETSSPATLEFHQRPVCTSPRGMFDVHLQQNSKTSFSGNYLLQVTGDSIVLHASSDDSNPIVTWKIKTLRQYGHSNGKFTFEAGRSAETGEGVFVFQTAKANEIYQKVHTAAQALAATRNRNKHTDMFCEGAELPVSQPVMKLVMKQKQKQISNLEGLNDLDDTDDPVPNVKAPSKRAPQPLPRSMKMEPDPGAFNNLMYAEPKYDKQASIPSDEEHLSDFGSEQITYREQINTELYSQPAKRAEQKMITDKINYMNYELAKPNTNTEVGENYIQYIYEEKGLTKSFREFLHLRKEDDC